MLLHLRLAVPAALTEAALDVLRGSGCIVNLTGRTERLFALGGAPTGPAEVAHRQDAG